MLSDDCQWLVIVDQIHLQMPPVLCSFAAMGWRSCFSRWGIVQEPIQLLFVSAILRKQRATESGCLFRHEPPTNEMAFHHCGTQLQVDFPSDGDSAQSCILGRAAYFCCTHDARCSQWSPSIPETFRRKLQQGGPLERTSHVRGNHRIHRRCWKQNWTRLVGVVCTCFQGHRTGDRHLHLRTVCK